MAILSACCFRYSIRQGTKAAGIYTLIYFLLFALLTGNYSYNELVSKYQQVHYIHPHVVTPTNSSLEATTINNNNNGTIDQGRVNNYSSPSPPPSHEESNEGDEPNGTPIGDIILLFVDLICEISGFIASILLLRGLQLERKAYLQPWLVIVPLHTIIDTFTVINIIILYFAHSHSHMDNPYWGFVTALTIILDVILNFINVFAFLCVVSQYQEYRAGRGTAAYEEFRWQRPRSVVRYEVDSGSGGGGCSVGGGDSGNNNGTGTTSRGHMLTASSANRKKKKHNNARKGCYLDEKSDNVLWCDDLGLDKLDDNDDDDDDEGDITPRISAWSKKRPSRSSRKASSTTTTRFDMEDDDEEQEQEEGPRSPDLPRNHTGGHRVSFPQESEIAVIVEHIRK